MARGDVTFHSHWQRLQENPHRDLPPHVSLLVQTPSCVPVQPDPSQATDRDTVCQHTEVIHPPAPQPEPREACGQGPRGT